MSPHNPLNNMSEVKEKNKEQLLESLNELEHLVKTKLTTVASKPSNELEEKLFSLEEKFQLMNEKNKKVGSAPGKKIKRGQKIGEMGNTGKSTAPHLHYEIHLNRKPKNPNKYLFDIFSYN